MTFSVCKYICIYIKRWTHGFSKHTSLESDASSLTRYLCHDPAVYLLQIATTIVVYCSEE